MKKLFMLAVAMAFVTASSAQTLLSTDFEDGTIGKWAPWNKNMDAVKVVSGNKAKDSQYALCYRTGMSHGFGGVTEKTTYKVSFDSNIEWGKNAGTVAVHGYNKETEKMDEIVRVDVPNDKGYKKVEFTFKAKTSTYHRITLAPGGNGGEFIVDNLKIEAVK